MVTKIDKHKSGKTKEDYNTIDQRKIEAAIRDIIEAIGENPQRDGLIETPRRVARAFAELFSGINVDPSYILETTFDIKHSEIIIVKDIPLYSTCEHHLVPFYGHAHIGYIPGPSGKVTGLSKLARLVEVFARRLQIQERLTTEIAESMMTHLEPSGVIVLVECEHLCMSMRGIKKPGAKTVTSAVRGKFLEPAIRSEALELIRSS